MFVSRPASGLSLLVSCAVGFAGPASAASAWSFVPSPDIWSTYSSLNAVQCLRPDYCIAVGDYAARQIAHALIERWNGKHWSIIPSPSAPDRQDLRSVTCTAPGRCIAVGSRLDQTWTVDTTLIEMSHGREWTVEPSPNPPHSQASYLESVSCPTHSDCFAVGSSSKGPLVEHWNGKHWSIVPVQAPVDADAFYSVACTTGIVCVAVGATTGGLLVGLWNGKTWTAQRGAPVNGFALFGVSCPTAQSCFAVGSSDDDGTSLIEHWDGTTWSILASPKRVSYDNDLRSVSCASASDCVAVGLADVPPHDRSNRMIIHWNGSSWSLVPNTGPASTYNSALWGVSCTSANYCAAVGSYNPPNIFGVVTDKTLVENRSQ